MYGICSKLELSNINVLKAKTHCIQVIPCMSFDTFKISGIQSVVAKSGDWA